DLTPLDPRGCLPPPVLPLLVASPQALRARLVLPLEDGRERRRDLPFDLLDGASVAIDAGHGSLPFPGPATAQPRMTPPRPPCQGSGSARVAVEAGQPPGRDAEAIEEREEAHREHRADRVRDESPSRHAHDAGHDADGPHHTQPPRQLDVLHEGLVRVAPDPLEGGAAHEQGLIAVGQPGHTRAQGGEPPERAEPPPPPRAGVAPRARGGASRRRGPSQRGPRSATVRSRQAPATTAGSPSAHAI